MDDIEGKAERSLGSTLDFCLLYTPFDSVFRCNDVDGEERWRRTMAKTEYLIGDSLKQSKRENQGRGEQSA